MCRNRAAKDRPKGSLPSTELRYSYSTRHPWPSHAASTNIHPTDDGHENDEVSLTEPNSAAREPSGRVDGGRVAHVKSSMLLKDSPCSAATIMKVVEFTVFREGSRSNVNSVFDPAMALLEGKEACSAQSSPAPEGTDKLKMVCSCRMCSVTA